MSLDFRVPFYSNTPDDTHCFQAALRMVLKFYSPNKDFSWEELEKMTAKVKGLWTWPMAGLLWMNDHGFKVIDIEEFDYKEFIKKGGQYLINTFGKDIGEEQIKQSYLPQEIKFSKNLLRKRIIRKYRPTKATILRFLDKGYLVICNINMQTLNHMSGYIGHFVVTKGYNGNGFLLHDPGLPPQENRFVTYVDFEKAWAYPDKNAKNLMAFKPRD